jgi:hypothetical protein
VTVHSVVDILCMTLCSGEQRVSMYSVEDILCDIL